MAKRVRGRVLTVPSVPREDAALDVRVNKAALDGAGFRATLASPIGTLEIESALVGDYNFANVMLAVGAGIAHGLSAADIERGIAAVPGVPGRLQPVPNHLGVLCVVDYAHTPDALKHALTTLRELLARSPSAVTRHPSRLICVFGCGGERDPGKRPHMGRVAAQLADRVVVTSDNPRGEEPAQVIRDIVAGVPGGADAVEIEPDRRAAILRTVAAARRGDIVLLAGKGHETYQEIRGVRLPFSDAAVAREALSG